MNLHALDPNRIESLTPYATTKNSINLSLRPATSESPIAEPPSLLFVPISDQQTNNIEGSGTKTSSDSVISTPLLETTAPFVPQVELKDPIPQEPPLLSPTSKSNGCLASDILPPEVNENGQLRFPWAAKMDPKLRNLHRTTKPTYMDDGTPIVEIPNHVLMQGLENQKEYIIGQFYRCLLPSGGLIHAVANRIWGKKCKIFSRKLGEFSYLFHIPEKSTRDWVLERGVWHFDDCIMFVAPWSPSDSLALPEISTIPMWVTLKQIPACLYSDWGISWIASGLGEPMATHKPRLDPNLIGEAKLMVEVELDKAFPHRIAATDEKGNLSMVQVLYSWIPSQCQKCRQIGLKESRCLSLSPVNGTVNLASSAQKAASLGPHDLPTPVDPISAHSPQVTTSPSTTGGCHAASLVANNVELSTPIATDVEPSTPIVIVDLTSCSSPKILTKAVSNEFTSTATVACNSSSTGTIASAVGISHNLVTLSTPFIGSLVNEHVQGKVFGSTLATLDSGDYSGYEIGVVSQKTRGGRSIKPTQKIQEMEWTTVRGKGKRGRGGRGDHFQT